MKKIIFSLSLLIGVLGGSLTLSAQKLPDPSNPSRLVNDFASMLSSGDRASLESKLVAFDDSTTNQIAIVTVDSLNDDISDFAIKLFQKWKIGVAKKDNGVLILISKTDRKMFITTGRGLEGPLPDAICKRIVDLDLIPNFKQGKFYAGLDMATTEIMQRAKGEFHEARADANDVGFNPSGLIFLIILIIFLIIIFTRGGGNNQVIGGGGFPWWLLLLNSSNSGGSSWGGNSGGGFGGGDSGSGGFGGFGGGDTGGGGAGGSW